MEHDNNFDALVDAIHAGALSPIGLDAALTRMAVALGGMEAGCVLWDRRTKSVLAEIGASRKGNMCQACRLELAGFPLHNEVMLCAKCDDRSLCCRLSLENLPISAPFPACAPAFRIVVRRAPDEEPFGDAAIQAMRHLLLHLRRALSTFTEIRRQRLAAQATAAALDALGSAAMLIDGAGRILFANSHAEFLLHARSGLARENDILVPTQRESRTKFTALISRGGEATIACGHGGHSLVRLLPLVASIGEAPLVLVLVCDPRRNRGPSTEALQGIFGLTPREADLAQAMGMGKTLREFAAAEGVGLETARSHLHAVFAKTGAHRQAELVRLLAGVPEAASADRSRDRNHRPPTTSPATPVGRVRRAFDQG